MKPRSKTHPPGRIKIMASFSKLMKQKDFHSITTAQIAANAGVTEGLIYKYFRDKKDLLHEVLNEHFKTFQVKIEKEVASQTSVVEKLETIIYSSLESYTENRVFGRILLLEVRTSSLYFESGAYAMVKKYARTILDIIREGVEKGELKPDTDSFLLRKVILGAIEHACLGEIIFDKELDVETTAGGIVSIIFYGVKK